MDPLNEIADLTTRQFSIQRQEEHLLMGYHALQQYILGSTLGSLYEIPLNYLLSLGNNTLLMKMVAELVAMAFNACGIIWAIRMYRGHPTELNLIPFHMGLVSHQPSLKRNSEEIVETLIGWVFGLFGGSMPVVN